MSNIACADCRFFVGSLCRRYPTELPVAANYWCGEFSPKPPSKEVLETRVAAPNLFSAYTLGVLRRNKIVTIEQLLAAGRSKIMHLNGGLDTAAIREIETKLKELGVTW